MKHAYMVMAHDNFNVLNKQLKLLDDERNDFFIHVDIKVGDFDKQAILAGVEKSKVTFIPRLDGKWGDYSLVQIEFELLKFAMNAGDYDYFHLLSGVDLPIKSKKAILDFYENSDKIYICCSSSLDTYQGERTKYFYPFINWEKFRTSKLLKGLSRVLGKMQKLVGVNRHKKKGNYVLCYCGWQWFSIPKDFAMHVIEMEPRVYSTFHHTLAPDESVIQTVAMNSEFKDRIYMLDEHEDSVMRFNGNQRTKKPYVFFMEDYDFVMNSPYLFARKFDERMDSAVIDRVYDAVSKMNEEGLK